MKEETRKQIRLKKYQAYDNEQYAHADQGCPESGWERQCYLQIEAPVLTSKHGLASLAQQTEAVCGCDGGKCFGQAIAESTRDPEILRPLERDCCNYI